MNFLNIEIEQGTDYLLKLVYTDEVTGLPKDLTGYTGRLAVRPLADMPPAIDLTTEDGTLVLGGASGDVLASFSPAMTSTQDWVQAPFDVILTDPSGVKSKLRKGLVTILPSEAI